MTFKKVDEKIVSLQMKGLVHFYHPPVNLRGAQNIVMYLAAIL